MSGKSVEEILVGVARGEPMDVAERARLNAALADSEGLVAARDAQRELTAELGKLRGALRAMHAPTADTAAMRAAFRVHRASHPRSPVWRYAASIALIAGLAAAGAMLIGLEPSVRVGEQRAQDTSAAQTPAASTPAIGARDLGSGDDAMVPAAPVVNAFQPLLYSPGFSPTAAYSIVRVRIPVSAFARSYATDLDGTVEADILIGEDGLPAAIRFEQTDALASMASP